MEYKTEIKPYQDDFLPGQRGYGCGYVGVSNKHPWFGMDYDRIGANVHGGLTYGRVHDDGFYWVGFDTAHLDDGPITCPREYVESEVQSLLKQAKEAENERT